MATGIVLAHIMADNMKAELVTETIIKAEMRWNLSKGCIYHNALGLQYTAEVTQELLKKLELKQRFFRPGKPGDNAWSESFFSILKKESIHWRHFQTREEAR